MDTLVVPEPGDWLVRTLSADGSIAVRALVATGLVGRAAVRHATAPTATAALGRTLMGALLMAAEAGADETLQIQLRGDGPLGTVTVIANSEGGVRGFVSNPDAHLPSRNGKLDVGRAVGGGVLAVVRHHPSWREPYSGIVPLISGEVAEDLAGYLLESEQKPSALALGVQLGPDAEVTAAGGYLVQKLPDASEGALEVIERRVQALLEPSRLLRAGASADRLVDRLLGGLGSDEVGRIEPRFHCPCSVERVLRALVLLGPVELADIVARRESLEVRCEFCAEQYHLAGDEVAQLLA